MTTFTHPTRPRGGFTLVEVLIGLLISGFLMAGVLSAFLMFTRSGVAVINYARMASDGRRAVDAFAVDARMASDQTWNSSTSVTLTVPIGYTSAGNQVTYYHDPTTQTFRRKPGNASSTGGATALCRDVASLLFSRFSRNNAPAASETDTKRIQLTMRLSTHPVALLEQTSLVVSASYVMRNNPSN